MHPHIREDSSASSYPSRVRGRQGSPGRHALVDPKNLAEVGDHQVFGEIQTNNPEEDALAEQPDVEGNGCHKADHPQQAELQDRSFHEIIMAPVSLVGKAGTVRVFDAIKGGGGAHWRRVHRLFRMASIPE